MSLRLIYQMIEICGIKLNDHEDSIKGLIKETGLKWMNDNDN